MKSPKKTRKKPIGSGDLFRPFFHEQGLVYLQESTLGKGLSLSGDPELSSYYQNNRREWIRLNRRYGRLIHGHALAPMEIRWIGDPVGYGVFAAKRISRNSFIGEYTGFIQPPANSVEPLPGGGFPSDYAWDYPDPPEDLDLEVNALKGGNPLRFINHSNQPNLFPDHTFTEGRWVIFFRSLRRINPGEQLLIDYGEDYWDNGYRGKPEEINNSGRGDC